jgi:hypothetical protein
VHLVGERLRRARAHHTVGYALSIQVVEGERDVDAVAGADGAVEDRRSPGELVPVGGSARRGPVLEEPGQRQPEGAIRHGLAQRIERGRRAHARHVALEAPSLELHSSQRLGRYGLV